MPTWRNRGTKMTAKTELLATVEKIRSQRFPDLPRELVEAIIEIESNYAEDGAESHKRVAAAIEAYLQTSGER